MTFPLMPVSAQFARSAPVWSATVGSGSTTTNDFAGGSITLTSSTASRLLVLFYQAGNVGGRIASITIGGFTPTTVAQVDGYYVFTLPVNTSGTVMSVSGVQSTPLGRSWWIAYELSGYSSETPALVMSAGSTAQVSSWSAMTSSNMATGGLFEGTSTLSVSAGSAPTVSGVVLEGATYNNFIQGATARGPVTYTPGSTTRYLFVAWG